MGISPLLFAVAFAFRVVCLLPLSPPIALELKLLYPSRIVMLLLSEIGVWGGRRSEISP